MRSAPLIAAGWQPQEGAPLLVLAPADSAEATLAAAASLRALGVAVAIGEVAEHAGREIHRARVVDAAHVEYDGVTSALEALAARLTRNRTAPR